MQNGLPTDLDSSELSDTQCVSLTLKEVRELISLISTHKTDASDGLIAALDAAQNEEEGLRFVAIYVEENE